MAKDAKEKRKKKGINIKRLHMLPCYLPLQEHSHVDIGKRLNVFTPSALHLSGIGNGST